MKTVLLTTTSHPKIKFSGKSYDLWRNHINYLTQDILKENRFLGHALHPMQLFLIKELHLISCENSIPIQIYALEPANPVFINFVDLFTNNLTSY